MHSEDNVAAMKEVTSAKKASTHQISRQSSAAAVIRRDLGTYSEVSQEMPCARDG